MKTLIRALCVWSVGLLSTAQAHGRCPYSSVQARVQRNEADPWKEALSLKQGESFRVGAFQNGWGVFTDCCATLSVTRASATWTHGRSGCGNWASTPNKA